MKNQLIWGCIADDFTGASDAASFFVQGGMQTMLYSGVPNENKRDDDCQAIVVALKTRTQETSAAVEQTLQAARWLKQQGAQQLYIKYCSTFDSTPQGNIGPILDALLEEYQLPYTILCPALPVNGRVVKHGQLYINGTPLNESPMKDHPLTPMWDSRIAELMKPQSKYPCLNLTIEQYSTPRSALSNIITAFEMENQHFYIVPDYETEKDAVEIADLFGALPVLSGGSGILTALARRQATENHNAIEKEKGSESTGVALILAGSCSEMTRKQIAYAQAQGVQTLKIEPLELLSGKQTANSLWEWIVRQKKNDILVYSSDTPEQVKKNQTAGKQLAAEMIEQAIAALAVRAVESGYTRIIVAGGETSGAVTHALGFDSFRIGASVAPGVPVMIPRNRREIRLVLKSGNFGQEDFFLRALALTK